MQLGCARRGEDSLSKSTRAELATESPLSSSRCWKRMISLCSTRSRIADDAVSAVHLISAPGANTEYTDVCSWLP